MCNNSDIGRRRDKWYQNETYLSPVKIGQSQRYELWSDFCTSKSNLHHEFMRTLPLSLSRCDKMCTPVLGYAGYRLACGGRLPPQTSTLDIFCLSGTATTLYMLKTKSPCQKHAAVLLYLSFAHDILAFIGKNFVLTFCRRKFDPARTSDLSQIFFFFK